MKAGAYMFIGLLTGLLLAGALVLLSRQPGGKPVTLEDAPTKVPIEVHVVGAVLRPGVYLFAEGSRVQDAITATGGLTSNADLGSINLAARLEDGQQLQIPTQSGQAPLAQSTAAFTVLPGLSTPTPSTELININTAPLEDLESLPGIGPTIAQRIVQYRDEHGPFQNIEDIQNVAGIGPATFDQIKALITV